MRLTSRSGALVWVLLAACMIGSTAYSTRLATDTSDLTHHTDRAAVAQNVLMDVAALMDDGAELYMTRCMSCHQMNGRGVPGVFPPLVDTEWVTGDKGRLIRVVLHGLTGEITVGDETYSGAMPPWKSFLDDDETAALLTYIRTSWGNDATEITPDEVAAVRSATEERRDPWTQQELDDEANLGIPGDTSADTD